MSLGKAGRVVQRQDRNPTDAQNLPRLAAVVDYLVVMAYDQYSQFGTPGPVASRPWFRRQIDALRDLPREKLIVGLGNYGYDWALGTQAATVVTFADVMAVARSRHGAIAWDDTTNDFDWARTSALPQALRGYFAEEPLYIDMRWARTEVQLDLTPGAEVWRFPIATVSRSERGFEETVQGYSYTPRWPIRGGEGQVTVRVRG